jgi:hypothetical protein
MMACCSLAGVDVSEASTASNFKIYLKNRGSSYEEPLPPTSSDLEDGSSVFLRIGSHRITAWLRDPIDHKEND